MQNWRTTLIGGGLGFLNTWGSGGFSGTADMADYGISFGMLLLGMLSKDYAVSGAKDPTRAGKA